MKKISCGILAWRKKGNDIQFFLVHPGGSSWANKDLGCWGMPRGERIEGESAVETALREFKEETGADVCGELSYLGRVKQNKYKDVNCFSVELDLGDDFILRSNEITVNGETFPEVDKGIYFCYAVAKKKISPAQLVFLDEIMRRHS